MMQKSLMLLVGVFLAGAVSAGPFNLSALSRANCFDVDESITWDASELWSMSTRSEQTNLVTGAGKCILALGVRISFTGDANQ